VVLTLLVAVVAACTQAVPPVTLSGELRAHVQDGRFGRVTAIRGLPLGVRDALQALFGSATLDIANPGDPFPPTGVVADSAPPIRRLVAAGCTMEYCLVYYERAGGTHTWHAALFHWTPAATRFEWGGIAPGGLADIDAVRTATLSGAIKAPIGVW
jgi:hypothetical protein